MSHPTPPPRPLVTLSPDPPPRPAANNADAAAVDAVRRDSAVLAAQIADRVAKAGQTNVGSVAASPTGKSSSPTIVPSGTADTPWLLGNAVPLAPAPPHTTRLPHAQAPPRQLGPDAQVAQVAHVAQVAQSTQSPAGAVASKAKSADEQQGCGCLIAVAVGVMALLVLASQGNC